MNSSLAEVINRQTTHKQKPSSYVLYSPVVEAKTKEKMMKEIQCKYVSNMVEYIMPCGNTHTTLKTCPVESGCNSLVSEWEQQGFAPARFKIWCIALTQKSEGVRVTD